MIEVNLLPGGKKRASRGGPSLSFKMPTMDSLPTDPWVLGGVAVVILVLAAAAFFYYSVTGSQAELTVAVEEAAADSARYQDLIQQNEALTARQAAVAERVGVIQDIDEDRYIWPHIMDEVALALPDYTWLTQLLQVAGGDELQFRLQGLAGNPFALAQFMENLEASPFVRNVDLISTQREEITTGTGVQRVVSGFELEAYFERPPAEFLTTVPLFEEEAVAEEDPAEPAAEEAEPTPPDTAGVSGQSGH